MKLFSYEDIGAYAKYVNEIYYGCLIATGVICLIALIIALTRRNFFKRFLGIIITGAIGFGLWWGSGAFRDHNIEVNKMYDRYAQAYANNEVITIKGQVKDFTPATESKTFTLDGVKFVLHPAGLAKPTEGTNVILYYTYKEASVNSQFVQSGYGNSFTTVQTYSPEKCVILGDNQWLEIQYIVEDGENRILYIGEIAPIE